MLGDSHQIDFESFAEYTRRLEELAELSSNDIRYGQYAQYTNCFISKFVKERTYLVGSTAEKAKLSFSKDSGDADVLIVSGKIQVRTENLEFKLHNPCYLWIRADECMKNMGLELVNDKYLSARLLRELRPELFTLLRAIHSQVTACVDRLPDANRSNTIVSVPSKVGLASTCYTGLKLNGNNIQLEYKYSRNDALQRTEQTKQHLIERWKTVKVHESDRKMLQRAFKALKIGKHPGGRGEPNGQLAFVVQAVHDALSRPKLTLSTATPELDRTAKPSLNIKRQLSGDDIFHENDLNDEKYVDGKDVSVRATYRTKHNRDFVPALKISGEIKYMQQWKSRVQTAGWPESKVNDIYSTDVFVISRMATVNPNIEKDFCLSFNLAEQKLVRMMTNTQRSVYLILKSYLKGTFEETHKKEGFELKLKTYHIKTLLFWLFESYQHTEGADNYETVYKVLHTALDFLRQKLTDRELFHYFIPSNLFIDFEDDDFRILIECVDYVKFNPVASLKFYFDLDDHKLVEKSMTPDELKEILKILKDGGRRQLIDKLEDAFIDIYRGLNESTRDKEGNAPIKEAVTDTFKLFLKDEKNIDLKIFRQINTIVTSGLTQTGDLSEDIVNKRIQETFGLIERFGEFVPQIKDFMHMFGGRPGLQTLLEGALKGTPIDFDNDFGEQLLETLDRYMSCSDEDEDVIAAELKYKFIGYFSGRLEFPHLSSLWI